MSPITHLTGAARARVGSAVVAGAFEWLRPFTTLPTGMAFNADTGRVTGAPINTAEPAWATVDTSVTDSGNTATNATNLQNKLNTLATSATGNTVVQLPAGFATTGQITLPANTSGYWIGIRTANHASLPTPTPGTTIGTAVPNKTSRVAPSHVAHLFEMRTSSGNTPCLIAVSGTTKYFIRGAYFSNPTNVTASALVFLDNATDVVFSQCYSNADCTTTAKAKTVRAFMFANAARIGVVDCYGEYIGSFGQDSQYITVLSGGSGWRFVNNYSAICSSSYHIISGGGEPTLPGNDATLIPRDGEIRWNTFDYPEAYEAITPGLAKLVVEFKMGQRWLVEANDALRYPGLGGQSFAWVTKVTNQNQSGGTNVRTEHICFRFNRTRNYKAGFSLTGIELGPDLTVAPDYIEASHNLCYDRYAAGFNGAQIIGNNRVRFRYNTLITGGNGLAVRSNTLCQIDNNVVAWTSADGVDRAVAIEDQLGNQDVSTVLPTNGTGSTISKNVWTKNPAFASSHPNNFLVGTDVADVNFTNYAARTLSLSASSAGYQASLDGKDCGVYLPLLNDLIAGII